MKILLVEDHVAEALIEVRVRRELFEVSDGEAAPRILHLGCGAEHAPRKHGFELPSEIEADPPPPR